MLASSSIAGHGSGASPSRPTHREQPGEATAGELVVGDG